jgi:hypothetical protein
MKILTKLTLSLFFSLIISLLCSIDSSIAVPGVAYPACYFSKGDSVTWKWGLGKDNEYFAMAGDWHKSPYTELMMFYTDADLADIGNSCIQSKKYYNLKDYECLGVFAAESSLSSNYPIISKGFAISPGL